jgi:beta-glucosidase
MMRRRFLEGSLAAAALAATGRGGSAATPATDAGTIPFPKGFLWGASTSAYQIEGAATDDGRGPSIWDVFSHEPGRIADGSNGDVACDHYHRYREDVGLVAQAGFGAYRFSTSWPRILPQGTGAVNAPGLDFYDRLVDALLAKKIEPWLCLYHWDLPQALQARGGWLSRDIADWFADYARVTARRLGDRVKHWAMFNEPNVHAIFGHGFGQHAPGLKGRANAVAAIHHQNLAQGKAIAALRAEHRDFALGTVLSLQPCLPVTDSAADRQASIVWDALWNRACLDPLMRGQYPDALAADYAPLVKPGDLEITRKAIDFLGINYYAPMHQRADPNGLVGTNWGPAPPGAGQTGMGWPIEPEGLHTQLMELRRDYGNPAMYVTENGAAFEDKPDPDGVVDDEARLAFIRVHLEAARRAIDDGANLKGYFVWSLLDNFEWGFGYTERFGIVRVDYPTQKRIPKASYRWLAAQAKA